MKRNNFIRVYEFMKSRNLYVRTRTPTSRIMDAAMQPIRDLHFHCIMRTYIHRMNNPKYSVDLSEIAIFLNRAPKRTQHQKIDNAVSVIVGGKSSMRFSCVYCPMDGMKLPLLVFLKENKVAQWRRNFQAFSREF